jgi:HK97 family phage prohead protease
METREMEFRVTNAADGIVEGIAVPYDQVANGEMFARDSVSLDPNAKLMWQHDSKEPIGKILSGRSTDTGFEITAQLSQTTRGKDAMTLLQDGVINRFSVGFIMRDSTVQENRTRVVTAADVKEVSLVSFPWYEGATVTSVREEETESEVPTSAPEQEETVEDNTPAASDLAEVREAITVLEREVAGINKVEAPVVDYRSAGEFLAAIATGDENAVRTYEGATTGNSVTTPIQRDLIRIVQGANPLGQVFATGTTPAQGMVITFARVEGITNGTDVQAAEGDVLGYYQLDVTTDSADIKTVGNYSSLSKQVIERSTVPYLDSVLRGQAIALGNEMANQLVSEYQAVVGDQISAGNVVTRATEDYKGWAGAILDAKATYFQPLGMDIEYLVVDTTTAKALLSLEGHPIIEFAGEATRTVGSADPRNLVGTIAGVPIVVSAALNTNGLECALVNGMAIRQYTSGAFRLAHTDAISLTQQFALADYVATAAEYPAAIVPILAD